ncbi:hypothetical protein [Fluviicola sp.]|uniref:hypothetical protein n=1 Tax=Fluviicola sp. TaxID=1917219 RepID=UPI0031D9059F
MGALLKRPILFGLLIGVMLLVLCIFVTIPMYDGIFHYDHELVHIQTEGKVALSYYFGNGLERTRANGILPTKIELKPIGYVLFILIHAGLPALVAIRFRMSNARKNIETPPNE